MKRERIKQKRLKLLAKLRELQAAYAACVDEEAKTIDSSFQAVLFRSSCDFDTWPEQKQKAALLSVSRSR